MSILDFRLLQAQCVCPARESPQSKVRQQTEVLRSYNDFRTESGTVSTRITTSRRSAAHMRDVAVKSILLVALIFAPLGCASHKYLIHLDTPSNPLAIPLKLQSHEGPQISPRTAAVLRRYALSELYEKDPNASFEGLQQLLDTEVDGEIVYSVSEMAYIFGKRAEQQKNEPRALDMYGVAVSNAYMYLFSAEFDSVRNPYDPQFRGACDLYNESLQASLRLVNAKGELRPGKSYQVTTGNQTYEVATIARGNWRNEDFERFEFVSEFELDKLAGAGTTYGLGVPLIAIRKAGDANDPREKYYPKGLSFPVTALLRVVQPGSMPGRGATHRHHCVLELHDPLVSHDLQLAGRLVPLQTDLSKSLAHFLDSDQFKERDTATSGLLNPRKYQEQRGIFMLEPFDPARVPVLMVHGLWSSPATWMPMFNDLRSFPELRKNYQFWFYQYPTGQPFWLSATQFREDLAKMREELDPDHQYPALDQAVLVAHSMGGLVSRLQTIESRDDFWQILSEEPFEKVQGDDDTIKQLRQAAFFKPNPSIRRVVTIGTPLRGSDYANDTTRWLSRKIIKLPTIMVATGKTLIQQNPGLFRNTSLLTTDTSIDSLSPDSPLFPVLLRAPRAPWVTYHNIVGMVPTRKWLQEVEPTGDGVVSYESAHADDSVSEVVVQSEHQSIHSTPKAILEVRRILIEHLGELRVDYRAAQLAAFARQREQATPMQQPMENAFGAATTPLAPNGLFGEKPFVSPQSDTAANYMKFDIVNGFSEQANEAHQVQVNIARGPSHPVQAIPAATQLRSPRPMAPSNLSPLTTGASSRK